MSAEGPGGWYLQYYCLRNESILVFAHSTVIYRNINITSLVGVFRTRLGGGIPDIRGGTLSNKPPPPKKKGLFCDYICILFIPYGILILCWVFPSVSRKQPFFLKYTKWWRTKIISFLKILIWSRLEPQYSNCLSHNSYCMRYHYALKKIALHYSLG